MSGYCGTPLAKKLGIRESSRLFVRDAPEHYERLLAPWPADETWSAPKLGIRRSARRTSAARPAGTRRAAATR